MLGVDENSGDIVMLHTDGAWTKLTDWIHEVPETQVRALEPTTEEGRLLVTLILRVITLESMLEGYTPPIASSASGKETVYEIGKITAFTSMRTLLQDEYRRLEP